MLLLHNFQRNVLTSIFVCPCVRVFNFYLLSTFGLKILTQIYVSLRNNFFRPNILIRWFSPRNNAYLSKLKEINNVQEVSV